MERWESPCLEHNQNKIQLIMIRLLPESWTNSLTDRSDVSKKFLMLIKGIFEIIKCGINVCQASRLLVKYYISKLGGVGGLGLYRFKKSHFLWSGERRENV